MNSLQKDFLKRSVTALENLTEHAKSKTVLPPEFLRETFRTLHTIKGTSQTLGFAASAKLAHELENLLSAAKENEDFKVNLLEGFALLIDSFANAGNFSKQNSFLEKISRTKKTSAILPKNFPFESEIFKQFSEHEKKSIVSEVEQGKSIFFVNAKFSLADFVDKLKILREKLSAKGEIIATFPNPKPVEKGQINFQICFASEKSAKIFGKFQAIF